MTRPEPEDSRKLVDELRQQARELGFRKLGIARPDLEQDRRYLDRWIELGRHGEMSYMSRNVGLRANPAALVPDTVRVIAVRMDYLPLGAAAPEATLAQQDLAYIARYALGRDYHKQMRRRLARLASWLADRIGHLNYRVFVDSAPVLERALARDAGLGWIGKHTNLLDRHDGSWFLLGEIFTDLPLPCDAPVTPHCGSCNACIDICPTRAIVAPYELDARRCIAYLTIEFRGSIPLELRPAIGNRIFGCDDCQLVCPWNRYARMTAEPDFQPRHSLDSAGLLELFAWSETEWRERTAGSALRRAGYEGWRRNIAVALGNGSPSPEARSALSRALADSSSLVREHAAWALARLEARTAG